MHFVELSRGLRNNKNSLFLPCTFKKLCYIKVENLVAVKVFSSYALLIM